MFAGACVPPIARSRSWRSPADCWPGAEAAPPQTSPPPGPTPCDPQAAGTSASGAPAQRLLEWPEFGLDPQRSDVSELATGITSANVGHLHEMAVALAGTVDSSPVYLHGALVDGAKHNVVVVTTTYGKTLAIDADSGRILWTFTPPGYAGWAGSSQITTASPLIDPDGQFVYAASPDGLIHKLLARRRQRGSHRDLARERDARRQAREACGGAQHRRSGHRGRHRRLHRRHTHLPGTRGPDRPRKRPPAKGLQHALCEPPHGADRPSSCPASDSAILSRERAGDRARW